MKFSIVIPTINRADLLKENYEDLISTGLLDASEGLVVIDNGQQDLSFMNHPKVTIFKEPKNLGVAGSWNKGIKHSFTNTSAEFVIVLNDDIVFGKTLQDLQNIEKFLLEIESTFFVSGFYWSVFLISKNIFSLVGEFDEQFYPAYFEDNDYHHRMKKISSISYRNTHELNPKIMRNSQTTQKDPSLNRNFSENQLKYINKWGGPPLEETR